MPTRIDRLTDAQRARFDEWADRWIEVGLRTGEADWERFEAAARECYRFAGIRWPGVVVRVPNPLVGALAAPIALHVLRTLRLPGAGQPKGVGGAVRAAVGDAVDGAVDGAVRDAVGDAVRVAVRNAFDGAVRGAVDGAVRDAVDGAVRGAVRDAVDGAVRDAVDGAVRGAVRDAVRDAVDGAVGDAVGGGWRQYLGGQFWAGGWGWWGAAFTSFFREVCSLELMGDMWERGRAWEATIESACWWWPTTRFVMVCDRPKVIELEQVRPRGWGSHRLHCLTGSAIAWNGWELFYVHGVRVPAKVVTAPETLTVREVLTERNAEVRRVMVERLGADRLMAMADEQGQGVTVVHEDTDPLGQPRRLLRIRQRDDEDLVMVHVLNSTAEPDGSFKPYMLRVPPTSRTCQEAVAWSFDQPADDYAPAVET